MDWPPSSGRTCRIQAATMMYRSVLHTAAPVDVEFTAPLFAEHALLHDAVFHLVPAHRVVDRSRDTRWPHLSTRLGRAVFFRNGCRASRNVAVRIDGLDHDVVVLGIRIGLRNALNAGRDAFARNDPDLRTLPAALRPDRAGPFRLEGRFVLAVLSAQGGRHLPGEPLRFGLDFGALSVRVSTRSTSSV